MKSGIGKLTFTNGFYYEGEFADDIMHGDGSMCDGSEVVVLEGEWNKGRFEEKKNCRYSKTFSIN